MKKILVLGAGRSSTHLIDELLSQASRENWTIRVGDLDIHQADARVSGHAKGESFSLKGEDQDQVSTEIRQADLVISMLPAFMHVEIARQCLAAGRHMLTPSYVAEGMQELHSEALKRGLLFLNEMGVDPGIDHMSAMMIIDDLKEQGAEIQSFESFTGGLVAPENDDNPWHYKISWNPRNVVLAGYGGTARYMENSSLKFIPYHQLFSRVIPIRVDNLGEFEGYANRDSLKYRQVYGLENIPTIFRGTLRRKGFCAGWDALVRLGLTDDSFQVEHPGALTWRSLTNSFLPSFAGLETEAMLRDELALDEETLQRLKWLGIMDEEYLDIVEGTPAQALQALIEKKWKLREMDKDMIVMYHRFRYRLNEKTHELVSTMVAIGEDPVRTAMSKTVGLPIAIAAGMIMNGELKMSGVVLPVKRQVYQPVMERLREHGIYFTEKRRTL